MTIRDLEIFIAVAETEKMGSAAKLLYITQPTVSHAITQIEEEYHIKLFERLSKKLYITETGREFLQYARHITSTFHEMEQYLHHASSQLCIHVGASLTVGSFFLSKIITQFEQENPNISIRVYIDNSMNIIRKISEGTLDVAVIEGTVRSKDIIAKEIHEDEMVLICGKNHSFASRESVKLSDLAGKAFVLREEGSGTREFLTDLTENRGIPIIEKWICHSSDSIINIVAAGQGVSILSKSLLTHQDDVKMLAIHDLSLQRSFKIIYHKDKFLSSALKKLIADIESRFHTNEWDKRPEEPV